MNLKIKFRESFRPFAPSVLEEKASVYFDVQTNSPYMLLTADVRKDKQLPQPFRQNTPMLERLKVKRSDIPAVTHLDYSARLQTVSKKDKRDYYEVISEFDKLTGCPVIVNTSFNVRGEPIVCTPEDAYRCFMRTEMDVLIMENCMLLKEDQPTWEEAPDWRETLELD
jgi:carbamoyltransferase